jgi:hypothetical protein
MLARYSVAQNTQDALLAKLEKAEYFAKQLAYKLDHSY